MMKKLTTAAASAAMIAVFASGAVHADANPFGMQELSTGYNVAMSEGSCGEGKCGCDKGKEAKCGEGKCGGDKAKEAKCGEGKCGGDK
ncbi:MAG: low-complexity protein [Gammaproteobacteria bacterium]|nr:MAG: low-complexity protein [Gammaproteobacteria bacterium]